MVLVGVIDAMGQHDLGTAVACEVLEVLLRLLPVGRQPTVGQ
jgi:hypothetical protein